MMSIQITLFNQAKLSYLNINTVVVKKLLKAGPSSG